MAWQKPVAKFRAGQVSCAVWENDVATSDKTVTVFKTTLERRYKDGEGKWRSSGSLSRNELPLAMYCLQKAFEYVIEHSKSANGDGGA